MEYYEGLEGILLVDDDVAVNFIHKKVIECSGIATKVEAMTNVQDALDFLTHSGPFKSRDYIVRPGLIFLDINMPGLDGWDFMEAYHQIDDKLKAVKIVVMVTTSLNPADHARALKDKEIGGFITKPLTKEKVIEIVEQFFEKNSV